MVKFRWIFCLNGLCYRTALLGKEYLLEVKYTSLVYMSAVVFLRGCTGILVSRYCM